MYCQLSSTFCFQLTLSTHWKFQNKGFKFRIQQRRFRAFRAFSKVQWAKSRILIANSPSKGPITIIIMIIVPKFNSCPDPTLVQIQLKSRSNPSPDLILVWNPIFRTEIAKKLKKSPTQKNHLCIKKNRKLINIKKIRKYWEKHRIIPKRNTQKLIIFLFVESYQRRKTEKFGKTY